MEKVLYGSMVVISDVLLLLFNGIFRRYVGKNSIADKLMTSIVLCAFILTAVAAIVALIVNGGHL